MKIKQFTSQIRRDFWADYECETCGYVEVHKSGYDDRNFHENVVPNMKCPHCCRTSKDSSDKYSPLLTKYPEGYQILKDSI